MDSNQLPCAFQVAEIGEKLGIVATRLERILAAQEELLELNRNLATQLHPAEQERRTRMLLEESSSKLRGLHDSLEKRLTIKWLGVTSLFGFIVYVVQLLK